MSQEKRTVKITLQIEVETSKNIVDVKNALEKGIYKGLDSSPNYIAPPKDVIIKFITKLN